VSITAGTLTIAKITVQSYFRNYYQLAGLTGTASQVAGEFKRVYRLSVTTIPTRKPSQRSCAGELVYQRYDEKTRAIAIETMRRLIAGQAVLIGTPSVSASQKISQALTKFEIEHQVLNCLEHEGESKIIEQAGQPGRVTVATNMAGRGTDIHVSEQVLQSGGLHIIATAKHSSSRIDRQLIGRTARQGQPGSFQFVLSLDDELFSVAGESPKTAAHAHRKPVRIFNRAQSKIERLHQKQRLELLEHEKKRHLICLQTGLDPCLDLLDE
jgi:preprotein translocase subunit SecA